ncbi:MAG: DNA repair protein RecN [Oscillospiraceae bacterium]|nr:DNA repair protein RecN [Oscillospiraceae bacterium]
MLKEIYIKNLAVIKEAVIPLEGRLNVFTGETGAGKSILINGINAVLGQRCTRDIVRTGCSKAEITALFTELSAEIENKLDELGIAHDNHEITLTREISADGGSVSRINRRTAPVALLKEIGAMLINIHGQHDNQVLLDSEKHLLILDSFGGDSTLLDEYTDSFRRLQQTARKLGELKKLEQSRRERSRQLNEIIEDIGAVEPEQDEDDRLEKEYETARNAEQTIISINNAVQLLTGDDAVTELLNSAEREIGRYTETDSHLNILCDRISAAEIELSDIASELGSYAEQIDLDGQRLESMRERLSELNKLKRKYMCSCNELREMYSSAVTELAQLDSSADEIKKLADERSALLHTVTERAKALYDYREKVASEFVRRVGEELKFLNMPDVVIEVCHGKGKLTVHGMDTVEFLISANKGEAPRPISKIASGGELSRIMLALKGVIADKDSIPTMIFDEIDTGVSGKAAHKIGIKLREIGKVRQVLCVTHLSQIAVMADHHLMIEKGVVGDRTETNVTVLDFEGRKQEIARIMGGDNPSQLMLDTAGEELCKASEI